MLEDIESWSNMIFKCLGYLDSVRLWLRHCSVTHFAMHSHAQILLDTKKFPLQ